MFDTNIKQLVILEDAFVLSYSVILQIRSYHILFLISKDKLYYLNSNYGTLNI